jgi:hypothetical protein
MSRNLFAVTGVAVLLGLTLACTKSSTPLSPTTPGTPSTSGTNSDDSTLKVSAPALQSPANDTKPNSATLVVSASAPLFGAAMPLQYRFQVFNSANALIDEQVVSGTSYQVQADLTENQRYTWRARGEFQGEGGPWSPTGAFIAPESAFLNRELADKLTNGKTVGVQLGGRFLPGQGWQSLSHYDSIYYDLTEPCTDNCLLEFDITNIGEREGVNVEKDLKFLSMGNAGDFGSLWPFRQHDWKMHLEQRSDSSSGMKVIWRNGGQGGGEPGDHEIKLPSTAINWESENVYHFAIEWATTGFVVRVNDHLIMRDGFGGHPYAPPKHRIMLGCTPRGESFNGIIYRNVRLRRL